MNREQFQSLMNELRNARSDAAAAQLVAKYQEFVVSVVRQYMGKQIRRRFDSIDFTQQVWASFFRRYPQLDDFNEPDNLKAFLRTLAQNKVIDQTRRNLKRKSDKDVRERSLPTNANATVPEIQGEDPTASQWAQANETRAMMFDRVKHQPPHYRRVIELRLDGLTIEEIASVVKKNEKTVRRIIRFVERGMTA